MSIATRIQAMEEHISDAYDSLSKFGVAAPSNKNIENIASLVNEIYDNTPKTNYALGTNLTLENTRVGKIDFKDTDNIEKIGLGATNQYTATGKNKLSLTMETRTAGGITITKNNDNSYKISGTSANLLLFGSNDTQTLTANTTYTLGITNGNNNVQLSLRTPDGNTQYVKTEGTATYATFTPTTDIEVKLYVRIPSGVTVNETIFPIVVEGSTIGTYEPYTGGIAVPNPSSPQNINVVTGNQNVKIYNKNLWQNSQNANVTSYGITLKTNEDNSVTMTGSATNSSIYFVNVKKIMASDIKDGNYTISFGNGSNTSFIAYRLRKYNGTTKTEIKSPTTLPIANYTYTLNLKDLIDDDTTQVELDFVRYGTGANDQTLYPQIEAGSTASSYAKYQSNEYEINLGKNLIEDETFVQGAFNESVGTKRISCRNIKLKANTTYTLSSNLNYSTYNVVIVTSTSQFPTSTIIYDSGWKTTNFSFTTGNEDVYANIAVKKVGELVLAPSDMSAYHFQIEKGSSATSYAPYFTPIELCQIGQYQDYIYKNNGNWFIHKKIGKIVLNGSENWSIANTGTENWYYNATMSSIDIINDSMVDNSKCTHYSFGSVGVSNTNQGYYIVKNTKQIRIRYGTEDTVANFKTWLSTNKPILYYVLATPIKIQITDTTLISQLDAWYNAQSMDDTTYITVDGDLPMQLKLRALKK